MKKIFITASGGPFLGQNLEQIKNKKAVDALKPGSMSSQL
ncbi:MAG: hypothetical protein VXW13_09670 [SAR324 cluster bacterium]|nr:hypothetical protein [SAR324 cluster bacterium]